MHHNVLIEIGSQISKLGVMTTINERGKKNYLSRPKTFIRNICIIVIPEFWRININPNGL